MISRRRLIIIILWWWCLWRWKRLLRRWGPIVRAADFFRGLTERYRIFRSQYTWRHSLKASSRWLGTCSNCPCRRGVYGGGIARLWWDWILAETWWISLLLYWGQLEPLRLSKFIVTLEFNNIVKRRLWIGIRCGGTKHRQSSPKAKSLLRVKNLS